jgi:esterase
VTRDVGSRHLLRRPTGRDDDRDVVSVERMSVGPVSLAVTTWPAEDASRPPVVLLPGTGSTADDWDEVAAALHARRTVHAVSLRGHGDSDWPGEYSIAAMVDDVALLLPMLGGAAVDVVGHSLGGLVAMGAAARRPDLVRRLVLEDVGLPRPRTPAPPARPSGDLPFDWAVVEQVRPEIDDPDPGWRDVARALPMPVLVVAGGERSPVPQATIADLVREVPDARAVAIDAGHLVHGARPDEFVRELVSFLDAGDGV